MQEQHPNSLEKVGTGLACSVETYRGCNIELVNNRSGFNGLSTNKSGEVRKIEVKSMAVVLLKLVPPAAIAESHAPSRAGTG